MASWASFAEHKAGVARVDALWVSAAKRAARAFVVTFVSFIIAAWIGTGDDIHKVSGLWDAITTQWDSAAGMSLLAALATLGLRGILDPIGWLPTGSDTKPADPVQVPSAPVGGVPTP